MFMLNYRTRSKYLPHVLNTLEIRYQRLNCFGSFISSAAKSSNGLLSTCVELIEHNASSSTVSNTIRCLLFELKIPARD